MEESKAIDRHREKNKKAFARVGYRFMLTRLMQSGLNYEQAKNNLIEDTLEQLSIENAI